VGEVAASRTATPNKKKTGDQNGTRGKKKATGPSLLETGPLSHPGGKGSPQMKRKPDCRPQARDERKLTWGGHREASARAP